MSKRLPEKVGRRARLATKRVAQLALKQPEASKQTLLIIGCQRSGTTLLTEILERDHHSNVFDELGVLFSNVPRHHRLQPLKLVRKQLARHRGLFHVIKPLVESQRADWLLNSFRPAKAIWLFRHYQDVAASNLARFGVKNGIHNLEPIVAADPHDWRSENLSSDIVALIRKHFAPDMLPIDAAALFWYVRNSLYFTQALDQHQLIRLCRYDELVSQPAESAAAVYRFIGRPYPGNHILGQVHTSSIGKGRGVPMSPAVQAICESMWHRLLDSYQARSLLLDTDAPSPQLR